MNILDDISSVTIKLIIREPFYGHYFTHIQRSIDTTIERVSLKLTDTGSISFIVNPQFWTKLNDDELKLGCIKHQILHLVFRHIYQTKKFGDPHLFNLAADLVVNQYLSAAQRDIDAITIDDFWFLKLKPHQSIDYYYRKLKEIPSQFIPENERSDSDTNSGDSGESGESDENTDITSESSQNPDQNTKKSARDYINSKEIANAEHRNWESFEKQSGAEAKHTNELLDRYTEMSTSRVTEKDFGLLPSTIRTSIKGALERRNPTINWKRMLRLFMQSSRKTYLKNTLKKPSKRYGTIPGIQIKQKQKVMITIDTSGSIEKDELTAFFNEIHHIYRHGDDILIVECDCEIKQHYPYKGTKPTTVLGGSCTNFDPPIEFANSYRPDVLIYFTDGHADPPTIKNRTPIIWVLSSNGIDASSWDFLPGRKIKI